MGTFLLGHAASELMRNEQGRKALAAAIRLDVFEQQVEDARTIVEGWEQRNGEPVRRLSAERRQRMEHRLHEVTNILDDEMSQFYMHAAAGVGGVMPGELIDEQADIRDLLRADWAASWVAYGHGNAPTLLRHDLSRAVVKVPDELLDTSDAVDREDVVDLVRGIQRSNRRPLRRHFDIAINDVLGTLGTLETGRVTPAGEKFRPAKYLTATSNGVRIADGAKSLSAAAPPPRERNRLVSSDVPGVLKIDVDPYAVEPYIADEDSSVSVVKRGTSWQLLFDPSKLAPVSTSVVVPPSVTEVRVRHAHDNVSITDIDDVEVSTEQTGSVISVINSRKRAYVKAAGASVVFGGDMGELDVLGPNTDVEINGSATHRPEVCSEGGSVAGSCTNPEGGFWALHVQTEMPTLETARHGAGLGAAS